MFKQIQILAAEPHHLPQILEIERTWNPLPWSKEIFKSEIANPKNLFLVAVHDNQVVGYGDMGFTDDEGHLLTFAVAQNYQQQGIGKRLLVNFLEEAKKKGVGGIFLEVRRSNEKAQCLYAKEGFNVISFRKTYYVDNREDALVMKLENLQSWIPIGC